MLALPAWQVGVPHRGGGAFEGGAPQKDWHVLAPGKGSTDPLKARKSSVNMSDVTGQPEGLVSAAGTSIILR